MLQFAYTSKLTFTKESIHAIRKSADFLGFNNLESACFDFLIPKFSKGKENSQEVSCRPCCRNLDSRNVDNGGERNQPKSSESQNSVPARAEEQTDFPSQCPQNTPDEFKDGEERLSLETCGPQMTTLSLDLLGSSMCPMLPLASPDADKADHSTQLCEGDLLEIGAVCNQSELSLADCDLSCDLSTSEEINPSALIQSESRAAKKAVETLGAETTCSPAACLVNTPGAGNCSGSLGRNEGDREERMKGEHSEIAGSAFRHKDTLVERSSVEREVAEHLAKGFWSDSRPSQAQALSLESTDPNHLDKASDFHWLKQLDLCSSVGDCPFLKDLETNGDPVSRAESLSHSEKSPCMSSLNSGDDSDLDSDGDAEANKKRAEEVAAAHE